MSQPSTGTPSTTPGRERPAAGPGSSGSATAAPVASFSTGPPDPGPSKTSTRVLPSTADPNARLAPYGAQMEPTGSWGGEAGSVSPAVAKKMAAAGVWPPAAGVGGARRDEEEAPSKASLKAWWSAFTKPSKKSEKKKEGAPVFGVPLRTSLRYASVAISMAADDGEQYVWGYVPVVVAKIGLYLKESATEVEGVFRIAGSQKRMKELQEEFDTPPEYGKHVDWKKYSVHDAASVLRRYLNQMPEPIIPLELYYEFRNVLTKKPFELEAAIKTYRLLISSMPWANKYLLLYVLDLLAVFARKSDKNLMPASNLAVIFQPGIFSHPDHVQSPTEHKNAVKVLEILIEYQDHFVLALSAPPKSSVRSEELTAASRPMADTTVMVPSDSDEEPPPGGWRVHEGGGARLGRRRTTGSEKKKAGRRMLTAGGAPRRAVDELDVPGGPPSRQASSASRTGGVSGALRGGAGTRSREGNTRGSTPTSPSQAQSGVGGGGAAPPPSPPPEKASGTAARATSGWGNREDERTGDGDVAGGLPTPPF